MSDEPPLSGKIALVTGASRGLGHEIAFELGKAGAHVVALARTTGGLEELDDRLRDVGATATLVPVDLRDYEAIDRLGATIHERWGRLDFLIGNAAILGTVTPLAHMKPEIFEDVFAVNVTANFRLLRSMDPLLHAAEGAQALFVTSGAVRSRRPFVGPYAASKAALETMVVAYAKEHEKTGLRINLFDPGTARTQMRAQYAPGENPENVTPPAEIAKSSSELLIGPHERTGAIYSFPSRRWLDS